MPILLRGFYALVYPGEDGGPHVLSGTTKNTGTPANLPVYRRVRLHDQQSGRPLREVWSDPLTGAYTFGNLREGVYCVIAFDHTGQYSGETETDIVVPTP